MTPVLKIADLDKEFTVCTDAFQEGIGVVLMQDGRVIAYEFRKLKEHEKRYLAYDLELTTIIHALKVWLHSLLGKKILLMTNHSSLTNFFKKPNLNSHQARCNAFLSEFDFNIKHLKGKENHIADALSRKIHH